MATPPEPLLDVRTTVVMLSALLVALLAGALSYLANHNIPTAFLVGGGALAVALPLFHTTLVRG